MKARATFVTVSGGILLWLCAGVPVLSQSQSIMKLAGGLDRVPVLNSNSPEVVQQDGILVSTLPPAGKAVPQAHLNYSFKGRFDIFAHHISRVEDGSNKTLHLAIVLGNPGKKPVQVDVLQVASYLSQPEAPFIALADAVDNADGTVYAGPGDRVSNDILRGKRQPGWPEQVTVAAGATVLLADLPIPVIGLTPPLNGRSLLLKLNAHGSIYAATVAMFAPRDSAGKERFASPAEWQALLNNGGLAGPRERSPTLPGAAGGVVYGRVAGVARGAQWKAVLVQPINDGLSNQSISFPISTVEKNDLGTGQVQSAPILAREPETAYAAHGNYGITYCLQAPLINKTKAPLAVSVSVQSPLKKQPAGPALQFSPTPSKSVVFRGTIALTYTDDTGANRLDYKHLVQHAGQAGVPLLTLQLRPGERRDIGVRLIYPPDATPPQVVTFTVGPLPANQ